tara:strand:+ start:1185 stop:1436 length:252 start_codon:yes stop_codon:yes gene_type:complete
MGKVKELYSEQEENNEFEEQYAYNDKEINSMILYLRVNRVAEMQYVDSDNDLKFYDYMSDKHLTREEVIDLSLKSKWKIDWNK